MSNFQTQEGLGPLSPLPTPMCRCSNVRIRTLQPKLLFWWSNKWLNITF